MTVADATPDMFGSVLTEIANEPKIHDHAALTEALMRRLHENGLSLEQLSDRRVMKRSASTLQKRARELNLAFPDYTPRALRPKRIRAAKRALKADALAYYRALQDANVGYIILLRMGDFYEAFYGSAATVAHVLNIVITNRGYVPMCGFPVHAAEDHLKALARAGHRVAVCEPEHA